MTSRKSNIDFSLEFGKNTSQTPPNASRNENLATVKHVYASNTKLKLCTFQHKEKNSDFIHLRICYFKALSSDFVEMHIPLFFVRYTLSQNEIFLVCNYIRWKLIKFRRAGIYISFIISVKFLQIIKKTFSSTFNKKTFWPLYPLIELEKNTLWSRVIYDIWLYNDGIWRAGNKKMNGWNNLSPFFLFWIFSLLFISSSFKHQKGRDFKLIFPVPYSYHI